jgi:hypothetical protein
MAKRQKISSDGTTYICSKLELTYLPELPVTLKELYCNDNYLTSLPTLPPGLEVLHCGTNNLTQLPELPVTLKILKCNKNFLTSLPTLPPGLEVLDCELAYDYKGEVIPSNNRFVLPPNLPNTLIELNCQSNRLTALPSPLPHGLEVLDCTDNHLSALPSPLPPGLKELYCDHNDGLYWLPNLPNSLKSLNVDVNNLEIESLLQIRDIIKNGAELNNGYYKDLQRIDDRIRELEPKKKTFLDIALANLNRNPRINNGTRVPNEIMREILTNLGLNKDKDKDTFKYYGLGRKKIKKKTNRKRTIKKKTIKRKTRKY